MILPCLQVASIALEKGEVVNLERQFCNMQRPIVALILNFAKPILSCLQFSRDKQKYIRLDLAIKSRLEYKFYFGKLETNSTLCLKKLLVVQFSNMLDVITSDL